MFYNQILAHSVEIKRIKYVNLWVAYSSLLWCH